MRLKFAIATAFAGALLLQPLSAYADVMTLDSIKADVIGNTVGGGMEGGMRFTEFYAANGEIFGLDNASKPYKGKWSISGPGMCFNYEGTPEMCFEMRRTGNVIEYYGTDGKFAGVGTLQPGNAMGLK
jgi:hypothetical protein